MTLLVLFGIASTIEAFTVSHVFRFMPLYLATVQVPPAEVPAWTGYLNAAFFLFGLPLVPFWGVWAERYGRIPIIARSAFVEMVVFAVLWFAQNRWEAGFGLLLVGFQLGNTGVMLTALRGVTPPGRVGLAISLFGVSPSLGFALGPTVGGWLVDHSVLNLHTLFALDAALSLAAGVLLLAFAHEGPRPPAPSGSTIGLALGALRLALTGRITLVVFGVFGLAYFAQQIANPFLPLLVIRLIGGTAGAAGQIGIVFGASALLGALLSPLAGAAGDRYGFRPLLAGACVLAAASLAGLAIAPNLLWLTVGAVALGAATATAISMVFALLATAVPVERRATTLNLVLLPIYFSSVAGAVVGAILVRQGLNTVLFTGAAISLVAALLTTRLPSTSRTGP
ncbi:MAG: transporter, family, multidrug resistance protein [Chloroflexota bacterium]|nr:transporter, family, multidrug resistance protein [Chloroflexota bacterium]